MKLKFKRVASKIKRTESERKASKKGCVFMAWD
jgi:hypothetical protein